MRSYFLALSLLLVLPFDALADSLIGVASVIDGDTIIGAPALHRVSLRRAAAPLHPQANQTAARHCEEGDGPMRRRTTRILALTAAALATSACASVTGKQET